MELRTAAWFVSVATLAATIGCGGEGEPKASENPGERYTRTACEQVDWTVVELPDGSFACEPPPAPTDAQACREIGGNPSDDGVNLQCYLRTPGAGLPCGDSDDCESFCAAPFDTPAGTPVTGTCHDRTGALCWNPVDDGVAFGAVCQ